MSSSYGSKFKISLFGESHGPAMGVVIEGVRPGLVLDVYKRQGEKEAAIFPPAFCRGRGVPAVGQFPVGHQIRAKLYWPRQCRGFFAF